MKKDLYEYRDAKNDVSLSFSFATENPEKCFRQKQAFHALLVEASNELANELNS